MTESSQLKSIDDEFRQFILEAIHQAQKQINWKPGKAMQHLTKRIRLKHLSPETTLADYETFIATILNDHDAEVYIFAYNDVPYPTLVTTTQNRVWLAMISKIGTLETAFPPDEPELYLADPAFTYLGPLKELQKE